MLKKIIILVQNWAPFLRKPIKPRNIYVLGKGGESQLKTALTIGLLRTLYTSFNKGQIHIMNDLTAVKIGGDDLLIGDVSESDDYAVIGPGTEGVDVLHKTMLKYVDLHSRVVLIEIHKLADRYEKESSNKASFGSAFSKISSCSTLSDAISVAEKNWLTYFQKDGENEFAL